MNNKTLIKEIGKLQPERGHYRCYQSYKKIGLAGIRPVEERYEVYGLDRIINESTTVLDLGCNIGCFSLHVADKAKEVHGVEDYPRFKKISELIKKHLAITNCHFHQTSIYSFTHPQKFDVILSLAAHPASTPGFQKLTDRVYVKMLKDGGHLLIESRNFENGMAFPKFLKYLESKGFEKCWEGKCQCRNSSRELNVERDFCVLTKRLKK